MRRVIEGNCIDAVEPLVSASASAISRAQRAAPPTRIAAVSREGDRVRDRLAGKTILLTGGSGFLGKAVLAALLRNSYDLRSLIVLLRADSEAAAAERLRGEVLNDRAFSELDPRGLRARLDDGRLRALAGDLESEGLEAGGALRDVDTVIHCAATVSFEEPLDDALALNSLGPARLLGWLTRSGSRPHFVHVSTAYVADRDAGTVREDGVPHHAVADLDPEALLSSARAWRAEAEHDAADASRRQGFEKAARRDAARRPELDAAAHAEELRRRWVQQRLSRLGRAQALKDGWPDTYALSKAIGERLLRERSAHTTIVRPTIIESALVQPFPGWLEGIKVADPLILAYAARGLTHLPGRRSNRIDIVPVDHVANACVAAAAHPPEGAPRTIAVASTARNPLAIGELADQIKTYFRRDPLLKPDGSPIRIGDLEFVARRTALRKAARREKLAAGLARLAVASPVSIPWERALRGNRKLAERIARMVEIYGAYTELDCVFDDSNALALFRSLPAADQAELPFDAAAIDWDVYLQEIHLPQIRRLADPAGRAEGRDRAG
jgi:alcohol-forming fatty acyl-CoA reductase